MMFAAPAWSWSAQVRSALLSLCNSAGRGSTASLSSIATRPPGMGSTSRANGGVRAQFTTAVNIAFSQFTIEKLRELNETASGLVGFRAVGYLFLTGTDAGEIALRRSWELQRSLGVDVRWLSAREVIEHRTVRQG